MAAGEMIETVLSLRQGFPALPVAAALSAAHLSAIAFPLSLRRLYIVRDKDRAGSGARNLLIERAKAADIEPIVLSPALRDFNDDIRRRGTDALRAHIQPQLREHDIARFTA